MSDAYENLKKRAEELKDEKCEAFPNLICNEVPGFTFDDLCEPCKARAVLKCLPKVNPNKKERKQ